MLRVFVKGFFVQFYIRIYISNDVLYFLKRIKYVLVYVSVLKFVSIFRIGVSFEYVKLLWILRKRVYFDEGIKYYYNFEIKEVRGSYIENIKFQLRYYNVQFIYSLIYLFRRSRTLRIFVENFSFIIGFFFRLFYIIIKFRKQEVLVLWKLNQI